MALSLVRIPYSGAAMLPNYLLRLALVVILGLLVVQPARASGTVSSVQVLRVYAGSGTVFSDYPTACQSQLSAARVVFGSAYNYSGHRACVSFGASQCWYGGVGQSQECLWTNGASTQPYKSVYPSASVCPSNSIGTPCTCTDPYIPNEDATACVMPSCPAANTFHSAGFYNIGSSPNGSANVSPCVNGCKLFTMQNSSPLGQNLYISAYPKFRQKVNGIYYYFAEMSYFHSGQSCSPDTPNFLSDFVGSLPGNTCAPGQQMISMGGVTKCFNSNGAEVNANSASAVVAATALADAKAASAVDKARTIAEASGLAASDVAAAQSVAAGVAAAGGMSGDTANPDPVMDQFCQDNPTAAICAEQDFGVVEEITLGEKNISVAITPVSVGGAGSCPAPTSITIAGRTKYIEWTTWCNFANGVRPILLAFAWLSAAGLLVGSFRSA